MLRVLLVTGIFPPDIGGPATYIPTLADALVLAGHDVTVVTLSERRDDADDARRGARVVRVRRGGFLPLRWLRTAAALLRAGRRADVILANGLPMETAAANLLLRKPLAYKVVGDPAWERASDRGWTDDGFDAFQRRRAGPVVEAAKALRGWWARRADRIIVPSRYLGRAVEGWGVDPARIRVVPNGVAPADGVRPASVPLATAVRIAVVGRLVALKRVDEVVELAARMDGIGLVVVGDGPEGEGIRRRTESRGVAERVHLAGRRPHGETLSLIAACDLLVLNSTHEGLPHVLLEAMSVGVPVVATAVGGTPEVVRDGENGLLVPPGDGDALERAVRRVAGDEALRRRLAAGGRRTIARFGRERMVAAAADLLAALAREAT